MKKFKSVLSLLLLLAVFLAGIVIPQDISAKTKCYEFYSCYVKTFKKVNGRILIKTVKDTGHGGYKPITLKLKPAKNIKYACGYMIGENKYKTDGDMTFNELKKGFAADYKEYKKLRKQGEEFESPAGVRVYVKNNKIEKIILIGS